MGIHVILEGRFGGFGLAGAGSRDVLGIRFEVSGFQVGGCGASVRVRLKRGLCGDFNGSTPCPWAFELEDLPKP